MCVYEYVRSFIVAYLFFISLLICKKIKIWQVFVNIKKKKCVCVCICLCACVCVLRLPVHGPTSLGTIILDVENWHFLSFNTHDDPARWVSETQDDAVSPELVRLVQSVTARQRKIPTQFPLTPQRQSFLFSLASVFHFATLLTASLCSCSPTVGH